MPEISHDEPPKETTPPKPKKTKAETDAAKEAAKKAAQEAWQRDKEARDKKSHRSISTKFHFWRGCPNKSCRRSKACAGAEPRHCYRAGMQALPEDFKVQLRAVCEGQVRGGLNKQQALAFGEQEVQRWRDLQAKLKAHEEATRAPQPVVVTRTEVPQPRVRRL